MELTLIRGLPGSGKSTLAKRLSGFEHYEADMFFTKADGTYVFDGAQLKEAHAWCQSQVEKALSQGRNVVVSNTFTRWFEMEPYLKLASKYAASVQVIETKGRFQNTHNVPDEAICRMQDRWENIVGYF